MGLFDRLKEIFVRDSNIYESEQAKIEYKDRKQYNLDDIERLEGYIRKENAKIEQIRKNVKSANPQFSEQEIDNILSNDKFYKNAKYELNRWRYALSVTKKEKEFIRPNTVADIKYRTGIDVWDDETVKNFHPEKDDIYARGNIGAFIEKWKHMDFNNEVKKLRFHASPIATTKAIIESGGITSTMDRFDGYNSSTDAAGEISASPYSDLPYSIDFFMGVSDYRKCLPCGCVFAIYPKEGEEIIGYSMKNIDFKKNPEQLYAIFTTPENIENVLKWVNAAKLDVNVCTFEGFLELLHKDFSQEIPTDMEVIESIQRKIRQENPRQVKVQEEKVEELKTSNVEENVLHGNIETLKQTRDEQQIIVRSQER